MAGVNDKEGQKVVNILSYAFYDFSGKTMYAGGAERYLIELHKLITGMGYEIRIFQNAQGNWVRHYGDISVEGIDTNADISLLNKKFHEEKDPGLLTIYSPFVLADGLSFPNSVGISHGVYWDHPCYSYIEERAKIYNSLKNCRRIVSVDTNTINWVRAEMPGEIQKLVHIPNFVDHAIFSPGPENVGKCVILYPRRLCRERGFFLLADIIPSLLGRYPDIEIHFVGTLTIEDISIMERIDELREGFGEKVKFYDVPPDRMKDVYQIADIVVIPTINSEGTSLSCLEAMASGKPVVGTVVGGLSQLIIDGYNGFLINPDKNELKRSLGELIGNSELRAKFGRRAHEVSRSFDITLWRERWTALLNILLDAGPAGETLGEKPQMETADPYVITLKRENDDLLRRLNEAITEKGEIWNQLNRATAEKDSLRNRLLSAEGDLLDIYNSYTWRIGKVYERYVFGTRIHSLIKRAVSKLLDGRKDAGKAENMEARAQSVPRGKSRGVITGREKIAKDVRGKSPHIYAGGIKDRVSIILPVYNQANYLKEAIEGVLKQTYDDIELIVVNDGSTYGVEEVLDLYMSHPQVKILTQENQKLPKALNNGFEYATGEFYTWTSADNIMLPNQIEELVKFLIGNPDADMVFSDYQAIDDRGLPLNDPAFRPHNQDKADPSIMRLPHAVTDNNFHDSGDNFIGASFMYRRYAARVIGEYAEDTFGGEDYDYWLRLHNLFTIEHSDKILYKYRVHDNTLNAKAKELNLFENIKRLLVRDRVRRDFYKADLSIKWIGFKEVSNDHVTSGDKLLLVFRYSLKNAPEVIRNLESQDVVTICVVDEVMDEYSLDDTVLKVSDWLITTDSGNFDVLDPKYGKKLLCIDKVKENSELFVKIAKVRFFDRLTSFSCEKKLPSVYDGGRKLNVILQVDNFDTGGLEQVVYDLATHSGKENFNLSAVIVVNKSGAMAQKLKARGIDVLAINQNREMYAGIIRDRRVDIVNTHYSYFGLDKASECGAAVIETIHNSYTWVDSKQIEQIRQMSGFIDRYIAVSRQVKNYHRRKFGLPYSRIEVIPNGFNPEGFDGAEINFTRHGLGYTDDDFIFLSVAAFYGNKYHHVMVSAVGELAKTHRNIKLICVGSILDRGLYYDINRRIEQEGIQGHIKIMDYMDRKHLRDLYKLADCFLLPSIQEGWSIAAMEAMYFGLPLIMSDIGSARDVIKDSDIGIIIENPYEDILSLSLHDLIRLSKTTKPKNVGKLKAAMVSIYSDRHRWKEKAGKGKDKVLNEFSMDEMVDRYKEEFERCYHVERKGGVTLK